MPAISHAGPTWFAVRRACLPMSYGRVDDNPGTNPLQETERMKLAANVELICSFFMQ
jgi:hypothetical protein